jgi:hypothetical protein
MLARARRRLAAAPSPVRQRVQLVAADMTGFELAGQDFALALLSYNTLLHLDAAGAVGACQAVGRHLAAEGTLFIDVVNPLLIEQTPNDRFLTLERTFADPQTGDDVVVLASNWLDEATQTLRITWLYDVSPAGGGPVRRTMVPVTYHYYHPHQLELLLQNNGFQLEEVYGDYDQAPFTEASERLLLLAQKK